MLAAHSPQFAASYRINSPLATIAFLDDEEPDSKT
tara:strand:- start:174 stop:278 length:105 start_codon:yes stop_codon:yes gene_type:complete